MKPKVWVLVGALVLLGFMLLGLRRVPSESCVLWRWRGALSCKLACQGCFFAPPLVTKRRVLPQESGKAKAVGRVSLVVPEGSTIDVDYRALIAPGTLSDPMDALQKELAAFLQRHLQEHWQGSSALLDAYELDVSADVSHHPKLASVRHLWITPAGGGWWEKARQLRRWGREAQTARPLLVVGWDGADWELLERLLSQGRLPNLARLVKQGTTADLEPVRPLVSPLIWTTIATGMPPEIHGIFDFLRQTSGKEEPVRSTDRKAPALWNLLSALGVPVGVVAWWATWPAEPVRGFVISDRVAYQLQVAGKSPNVSLVWPSAAEDLLALRIAPEVVPAETLARFVKLPVPELKQRKKQGQPFADPIAHLAHLLASSETYHRLTLAAVRRFNPRALFVYEEGTDTIAHLFGPYTALRQSWISESEFQAFSQAVDEFYSLADRHLGELLAALGPEVNVILCSDHGFTWGSARPRVASQVHSPTAAYWHREPGILITAGPDFAPLRGRQQARVFDIAPTVAALLRFPKDKGWPGQALPWVRSQELKDKAEAVAWSEYLPKPQPASPGEGFADQAMVAKLRSLGYLGPGGSPATVVDERSLGEILNRGSYLLDKGDFPAAEGAFREATSMRPELPGPWIKLAESLRLQGKLTEAIEAAQKGLERSKTEAHRELAWLSMAMALVQANDYGKAASLLEGAVKELPRSFVLWNTLGGVYLEQGRKQEAYRALQEASGLREEPETLQTLAALEVELYGNWERATQLQRRAEAAKRQQPTGGGRISRSVHSPNS
ncbi:MAG: alkaline phosphatase family protein [Acidobacteriota bacterium]